MIPPGNGTERYRVEFSAHISERIKQLHRIGEGRGQGEAFRLAFRSLLERLQTAPLSCGEPVYSLHQLGLTMRKTVRPPVVLHFTAHPLRRVVWLSAVGLL